MSTLVGNPTSARVWVELVRSVLPALALVGCASLGYRDAIVDLAQFETLAQAPQVRYAPGAEAYARRVAAALPAAIEQVEAAHYRPFRAPPIVYVCGDDACFHRFVARDYHFTAAVVYNNRLLLSARLVEREAARLVPILQHELSHLHLGQSRGHYSMDLPVWFHEGFAALVADGGGADLATDADAWQAADGARHFLPDEHHRTWMRSRASAWGLSVSVFYRQAFLYLRALRVQDESAFRQLLGLIQDGVGFDQAFAQAYHTNPAHSAAAFFRRLHCDTSTVAVPGCAANEEQQ